MEVKSNIMVELLYSLSQEWAFLPTGEMDEEGIAYKDDLFVWTVKVFPFANQESAMKYIDRIEAFVKVDFPNPMFQVGEDRQHPQWEVNIVGPFEDLLHAAEFTDNLIKFDKGELVNKFTIRLGEKVILTRMDYEEAYRLFGELLDAISTPHSLTLTEYNNETGMDDVIKHN